VDDELKFWQERQRDLEEQLADVVERVRRLRKAGEGTSA
jgi:predicted  nucleic acid-binding Zn-ribbon protein